MKKLLSLVLSIVLVGSTFTFAFAESTVPAGTPAPDSSIVSPKVKASQDSKTRKEALKSFLENRKALMEQLKADQKEIQKDWAAIKEQSEKVKALKSELQPLRNDQTAINSDLKSQKETLKKYNQDLKSAVQSKDYTNAKSIMNKIAEVRAGMKTNLSKLMDIRSKIVEKVKSIAA